MENHVPPSDPRTLTFLDVDPVKELGTIDDMVIEIAVHILILH
jgi:hypothetical protein